MTRQSLWDICDDIEWHLTVFCKNCRKLSELPMMLIRHLGDTVHEYKTMRKTSFKRRSKSVILLELGVPVMS